MPFEYDLANVERMAGQTLAQDTLAGLAQATGTTSANEVRAGRPVERFGVTWDEAKTRLDGQFPNHGFDPESARAAFENIRDSTFQRQLLQPPGQGQGERNELTQYMQHIPVARHIYNVLEAGQQMGVRDRIESGAGTQEDYANYQARLRNERYQGDRSNLQVGLEGIAQIPAFGGEMALAAPFAAAGAAAVGMPLGTGATSLLGRAAQASPGWLAGETIRAAAIPANAASSIFQRINPHVGEADASAADVFRGYLDHQIEVASESLGGPLTQGLGAVGRGIAARLPGGARAAAIANALTHAYTQSIGTEAFQSKLKAMGFNGLLGEFLEERAGEVARGLTTVESDFGMTGNLAAGATGDRRRLMAGLDQLAQEGITLGGFSMITGLLGTASTRMAVRQLMAQGLTQAQAEAQISQTVTQTLHDPSAVANAPAGPLREVAQTVAQSVQHQDAQGPNPGPEGIPPPSTSQSSSSETAPVASSVAETGESATQAAPVAPANAPALETASEGPASKAIPGQADFPELPSHVAESFAGLFPNARVTSRLDKPALVSPIAGGTEVIFDPQANSVHVDIGVNKQGVGALLDPQTRPMLRALTSFLEGLKQQGTTVEYRAIDYKKEGGKTGSRSRVYEKLMEKAGYEKVSEKAGEFVWKPKAAPVSAAQRMMARGRQTMATTSAPVPAPRVLRETREAPLAKATTTAEVRKVLQEAPGFQSPAEMFASHGVPPVQQAVLAARFSEAHPSFLQIAQNMRQTFASPRTGKAYTRAAIKAMEKSALAKLGLSESVHEAVSMGNQHDLVEKSADQGVALADAAINGEVSLEKAEKKMQDLADYVQKAIDELTDDTVREVNEAKAAGATDADVQVIMDRFHLEMKNVGLKKALQARRTSRQNRATPGVAQLDRSPTAAAQTVPPQTQAAGPAAPIGQTQAPPAAVPGQAESVAGPVAPKLTWDQSRALKGVKGPLKQHLLDNFARANQQATTLYDAIVAKGGLKPEGITSYGLDLKKMREDFPPGLFAKPGKGITVEELVGGSEIGRQIWGDRPETEADKKHRGDELQQKLADHYLLDPGNWYEYDAKAHFEGLKETIHEQVRAKTGLTGEALQAAADAEVAKQLAGVARLADEATSETQEHGDAYEGDEWTTLSKPGDAGGPSLGDLLFGESGTLWIPSAALIKQKWDEFKAKVSGVTAPFTDDFKKVLAPASRGPESQLTGNALRHGLAEIDHVDKVQQAATKQAAAMFDKEIVNAPSAADRQTRLAQATDAVETGKLANMPAGMRSATEDAMSQLAAISKKDEADLIKRDMLQTFVDNYFPHIWEKPGATPGDIGQMFRRPLEGSKAFMRERTVPTIREGLDKGLTPKSWNPVELVLMKSREVRKAIMAHDLFQELLDNGVAKFVKIGHPAPEGWIKVDDKMMRVLMKSHVGLVQTGEYYMPEQAARILNNYLSPGLSGQSATYDILREYSELLNGAQLGFGAFHAGFILMDTQASATSLALQKLSQGDMKGFAKKMIEGLIPGVAAATRAKEGVAFWKEYYQPGTGTQEMQAIVQAAKEGGFHLQMNKMIRGDALSKFRKAISEVKLGQKAAGGSILRHALPALSQALSIPTMEYLVPVMKAGVVMDLIRNAKVPAGATLDERRAIYSKIVDSVDNRLGELAYDNLHLNRTFKDALMVGLRSVGWNIGTWREIGGGVKDVGTSAKGVLSGEGITPRTAYIGGLVMTAAVYGAMYQVLMGAGWPTEPKDYFFPRTGRRRRDGRPERVSLPSYMRDIAHVANRADEGPLRIASNVWHMGRGKINPGINSVIEMLNNENFFGQAIYDPRDSFWRQGTDLFKHVASGLEPFSIRNLHPAALQLPPDASIMAQGFFGITPSPSYIVNSWQQQRAIEAGQRHSLTPLERLRRSRTVTR